jgi:hypothetical protein
LLRHRLDDEIGILVEIGRPIQSDREGIHAVALGGLEERGFWARGANRDQGFELLRRGEFSGFVELRRVPSIVNQASYKPMGGSRIRADGFWWRTE